MKIFKFVIYLILIFSFFACEKEKIVEIEAPLTNPEKNGLIIQELLDKYNTDTVRVNVIRKTSMGTWHFYLYNYVPVRVSKNFLVVQENNYLNLSYFVESSVGTDKKIELYFKFRN